MARISSSNPKLSSNRLFNKKLIPVKVKDIILDGSTDRAANYGGYDSVGLIFYNKVQIKNDGLNTNPDADETLESKGFDGVAKPLFPFLKYYPLINEVVLILSTTSKDYLDNRLSRIDYYFPPINLWNHPHHNTLPAVQNYNKDKSEIFKNEDYEQAGLLRRAVDGEVDINIPLGKYFREQLNIKPLLPYEGDYIVEGRFGNTIRLGATARSGVIPKEQKNNWSNGAKGEVGDPITIIRNGQAVNLDNQGWVHTLENINTDPSSIYLTSNQKIDNFAIAAPDCWYSFGLNAIIPQNDNEEAKKFLDSPVDFLVSEPVVIEEIVEKEKCPPGQVWNEELQLCLLPEVTIQGTKNTSKKETETQPETQPEIITEEEAGFTEEEDTNEYYQLDEGQTELEIIERPPLPQGYILATGENNCTNCYFHENNQCSKWNAKVRGNHENPWVCGAWKEIVVETPPPPTPNIFPIRIKDSELQTENMVKSYGEVKIRKQGPKRFIDVSFTLVGSSPSTVSNKGTSDMSGASESEVIGDGIYTINSLIRNAHGQNYLVERGPQWPSSKIEEVLKRKEEKNNENSLPQDKNIFTIVSEINKGVQGHIEVVEVGKYHQVMMIVDGFGSFSSPNFPKDQNLYTITNTILKNMLPKKLNVPHGTVKVLFQNTIMNNTLKTYQNNIIA